MLLRGWLLIRFKMRVLKPNRMWIDGAPRSLLSAKVSVAITGSGGGSDAHRKYVKNLYVTARHSNYFPTTTTLFESWRQMKATAETSTVRYQEFLRSTRDGRRSERLMKHSFVSKYFKQKSLFHKLPHAESSSTWSIILYVCLLALIALVSNFKAHEWLNWLNVLSYFGIKNRINGAADAFRQERSELKSFIPESSN